MDSLSSFSKTEKILAIIIVVVITVIITGTVYGLTNSTREKKIARLAVPEQTSGYSVYDDLGRIRAKTKDDAVVVVYIAFPYDKNDRPFKEELSRQRRNIQKAIVSWFSEKESKDLLPSNEGVTKSAIKDIINNILMLNDVEELYFSEFSVITPM